MSDQHWNEFLDKLDFAQLTERWALLPIHWLDESPPENLSAEELALYQGLRALPKELAEQERTQQIHQLVRTYRAARSTRTLALHSSLTPPGSRVVLRYLDPDDLGQGDCLITVGAWDRLGYWIAQQAGWADEASESSENPQRKEPGKLHYRHVLVFPDKGAPAPRAFRALCEKTLRQARGLGARRLSITHLYLPQPGLPDRFAAAELVSAIRGMLREAGGGLSIEILVMTSGQYEDYQHWFQSLAALARGEEEPPEPSLKESPRPSESNDPTEPILANTLRDLAHKASDFAQEAGRGVTGWLKSASLPLAPAEEPPSAVAPAPSYGRSLELSYEDQLALNLFYLGEWQAAQAYQTRWTQQDSLVSLYLTALNKTLQVLASHEPEPEPEPEPKPAPSKKKKKSKKKEQPPEEELASEELPAEPKSRPETSPVDFSELMSLKQSLLETADSLGAENGLCRYFQLLAWRLDLLRPDLDPELFEEDHARLLRAAWAWEDFPLQSFLRWAGQEVDREGIKGFRPGYVPVYPQGCRVTPSVD